MLSSDRFSYRFSCDLSLIFHLAIENLQVLVFNVPKIPPDGGFGSFHLLFWLFSKKGPSK